MLRRDFALRAASFLAIPALTPEFARAQPSVPQEGIDYITLDKRPASDAPPGKIDVVEFFWYSCPHCNAFEPKLEAWIQRLPSDVALRRVPVAFRDSFVPQQRLFYTIEAMGKLDELHRKVFHAIHGQKLSIDNQERILEWIAKQGIDQAKFSEIYNSFTVQAKTRRAVQLQEDFKVQGVPSLGIGGRYYTDGTIAATMDRALLVTDYLIGEVRKQMPRLAPVAPAKAAATVKPPTAATKPATPSKPSSAPAGSSTPRPKPAA
jgi:thiol:disulfide interchange protein DsbA